MKHDEASLDIAARLLINAIENYYYVYGQDADPSRLRQMLDALLAHRADHVTGPIGR